MTVCYCLLTVAYGLIIFMWSLFYAYVLISARLGLKAEYRKIIFDVIPFIPPKGITQKPKTTKPHSQIPDNNYYKYGQLLVPKLSYTETDSEILEMLADIFLKKYA